MNIKDTSIIGVGDLVYNHRHWICPVTAISRDYITVIARHYGESSYPREDVHLIELTDDILKQLGWEEMNEGELDYEVDTLRPPKDFQLHMSDFYIRKDRLGGFYSICGNFGLKYLSDLNHLIRHKTRSFEIKYNEEKGIYIDFKTPSPIENTGESSDTLDKLCETLRHFAEDVCFDLRISPISTKYITTAYDIMEGQIHKEEGETPIESLKKMVDWTKEIKKKK